MKDDRPIVHLCGSYLPVEFDAELDHRTAQRTQEGAESTQMKKWGSIMHDFSVPSPNEVNQSGITSNDNDTGWFLKSSYSDEHLFGASLAHKYPISSSAAGKESSKAIDADAESRKIESWLGQSLKCQYNL